MHLYAQISAAGKIFRLPALAANVCRNAEAAVHWPKYINHPSGLSNQSQVVFDLKNAAFFFFQIFYKQSQILKKVSLIVDPV